MSLDPCPSSPNCICSQAEESDEQHYMEPISYTGSASEAIDAIATVISSAAGATVSNQTDDRVDAVFVTRIFRFKDDVSFLVDSAANQIHFRSASRVGHSDLGANRKRLQALLPQIRTKLSI